MVNKVRWEICQTIVILTYECKKIILKLRSFNYLGKGTLFQAKEALTFFLDYSSPPAGKVNN